MPRSKLSVLPDKIIPLGLLPPPELLELYARIDPKTNLQWVIEQWGLAHKRAFTYAQTALVIGGVLGLGLIGGFVLLVEQGHETAALILLGGGAVSLVTGFLSTRFR